MAILTIKNSSCLVPVSTTTTTIREQDEYRGLIYNSLVLKQDRELAAAGWHVPSQTEIDALATYLGGASVAGGKLKFTGTDSWVSPNTGATNEVGFNATSTGRRNDFNFDLIKRKLWFLNTGSVFGLNYYYGSIYLRSLNYDSAALENVGNVADGGSFTARLIKDTSDWTEGEKYIGNDLKEYETVKIGTQVWMAENLKETKWRDGTIIPEIRLDTRWVNNIIAGLCAYNDDWTHIKEGYPEYYPSSFDSILDRSYDYIQLATASNNASNSNIGSGAQLIGQSFSIGATTTLREIHVRWVGIHSSDFDVRCSVYEKDAVTNYPTATKICDSSNVVHSTESGYHIFNFSDELVVGDYVFVLSYENVVTHTGYKKICVGLGSGGNTSYSSGTAIYQTSSGTWYTSTNYDIEGRIYYGDALTTTTTAP